MSKYNDFTPEDYDAKPTKQGEVVSKMKIENDKLVFVQRKMEEVERAGNPEGALLQWKQQEEGLVKDLEEVRANIAELEGLIEANVKK